jgi:hypothetical protein
LEQIAALDLWQLREVRRNLNFEAKLSERIADSVRLREAPADPGLVRIIAEWLREEIWGEGGEVEGA